MTSAPTHWMLLQVVPAQNTGLQPPEHSEAVKPTSEFTAEAHVILETRCQLLNSPPDLESFVSPDLALIFRPSLAYKLCI